MTGLNKFSSNLLFASSAPSVPSRPSTPSIGILGGGVVGAAIAYELTRQGLRQVILVDAGPSPLEIDSPADPSQIQDPLSPQSTPQASQAALGVLMGVISHKTQGRTWELRQASLRRYTTLLPELAAVTGLAIPHNRQGLLKLVLEADGSESGDRTRARWEALAAVRRSQGWRLDLLSLDEVADRYPQVALGGVSLAVHSPQDLQVDPAALTRALLAGAIRQGAEVIWQAEALGWVGMDTGQAKILETTQGAIAADCWVIAAGLGSAALAGALGQPLAMQPVLGQGRRVRLAQPLAARHRRGAYAQEPVITGNDIHIVPLPRPLRSTEPGYDYAVGATVEFPAPLGERPGDGVSWLETVAASSERLQALWAGAIALCPDLAAAETIATWSGLRPRPVGRSAPVIDRLPGYDNVWLATGHYRNGILLAPATAEAVVQAITSALA